MPLPIELLQKGAASAAAAVASHSASGHALASGETSEPLEMLKRQIDRRER